MQVYGVVARGEKFNDLRQVLRDVLKSPRAATDALRSALLLRELNSPRSGHETVEEAMRIAFHDALRVCVDDWIDSGKNGGVDCPWERKIPVQLLREYLERNPPELDVATPSGPLYLKFPRVSARSSPRARRVIDGAIGFFLEWLDSPARTRLSRCDVCGAYFIRRRSPKKDIPIYHGTFCKKHKGKGGARRTAESRGRKKKQFIEIAAKWWAKWKPRHGKRSVWVADQVNQRLPHGGDAITGKWITQNKTLIEAESNKKEEG